MSNVEGKVALAGCYVIVCLLVLMGVLSVIGTVYLVVTGNNWFTYWVTRGECWQIRVCLGR